ncbi:MAG: helix-turn-helix transcriptional regulator [Treponema sp.]|nr:helix-turn-helix transcriptional regulator [Treponema sp.]MBR3542401.1 helix-turn-helix transcriptional regulator [Treponema sp.]
MTATGARIKELRLKSNLSVSEVQSRVGLTSPEAIYKWEKGKYMPSIDNCLALASIFGVRVEDLIVTNEIEI